MTATPTDRRRFYQISALVTSALGLSTACGIGARPSMPSTPAPDLPPQALLSLSPTRLTFDATAVGTKSPPQQITATNNNSTPLTFTEIKVAAFSHSADFDLDASACGSILEPGKSCTATIVYHPTIATHAYGRLYFYVVDHQTVSVPIDALTKPAP